MTQLLRQAAMTLFPRPIITFLLLSVTRTHEVVYSLTTPFHGHEYTQQLYLEAKTITMTDYLRNTCCYGNTCSIEHVQEEKNRKQLIAYHPPYINAIVKETFFERSHTIITVMYLNLSRPRTGGREFHKDSQIAVLKKSFFE